MSEINFLSRYVPSIANIDFDAEFDLTFNTSTTLASYSLETGQTMTNAAIQNQSTITMQVGVGVQPLVSVYSDPLEFIRQNTGAFLSLLVSNLTENLVFNTALSQVTRNLFKSYSRGGEILASLQALQLAAEPFDLLIQQDGILRNVLIDNVSYNKAQSNADAAIYDVSMVQLQSRETNRMIDTAQETTNSGEAKIVEV